jgi:ABC-type transporter Mla MlaB component
VPHPTTTTLAINGPIMRSDLPGLYRRVCARLTSEAPALVVCEVQGVVADAVTVDALARLALAARRHGCQFKLLGASEELLALVSFVGLADVFPSSLPGSGSR